MSVEVIPVHNRILAVRRALGITQAAFGEKIGVSQNYVWMLETGARDASFRVIRDVCREFGVSETWLRTGEGEMFTPRTREEELGAYVAKVFREDTPEFRRRLLSVLVRLDDTGWTVLEKIANDLTKSEYHAVRGPG